MTQYQQVLFGLIYLLIYVKTAVCGNLPGQGIAPNGGSCSITATAFTPLQGSPTGGACTTIQGEARKCSIVCGSLPQCKLVYLSSCNSDGQCSCSYCNQLTHVDFSLTNFQFYLHPTTMSTKVYFLHGLVAGQPLSTKTISF